MANLSCPTEHTLIGHRGLWGRWIWLNSLADLLAGLFVYLLLIGKLSRVDSSHYRCNWFRKQKIETNDILHVCWEWQHQAAKRGAGEKKDPSGQIRYTPTVVHYHRRWWFSSLRDSIKSRQRSTSLAVENKANTCRLIDSYIKQTAKCPVGDDGEGHLGWLISKLARTHHTSLPRKREWNELHEFPIVALPSFLGPINVFVLANSDSVRMMEKG